MTTVVNSPSPSGDNGSGLLIGILVLVFFGFLFVYYGLPAIRGMGTPQVNIPSKIDVNVNQPK
jgi:hypothetical protein